MSTESVAGEMLKTPEDLAGEARRRQPVERQFVAEPWRFSHPNRNEFPFRHQPLYFEDPNMERCGISCGCLTELTSAIHFAARIPALPLLVAATPPHTRVRSLPDCPTGGHFGPEAYWPPLTVEAAAFQAAMTVGLIFLIP